MDTPLLDYLTVSPPEAVNNENSENSENNEKQRDVELFTGPNHWVDDPSSFPSASAVVNESQHITGISVPPAHQAAFDQDWQQSLRQVFAQRPDVHRELDEYLATGTSNGRKLKLQMMVLPPGMFFNIHAHPNIEFEVTLAGCLQEFRWLWRVPSKELAPTHEGSGDDAPPLRGPEIAASSPFEHHQVQAGQCMLNETGSVHQSFTGSDPCVILVLWSGCHANSKPPSPQWQQQAQAMARTTNGKNRSAASTSDREAQFLKSRNERLGHHSGGHAHTRNEELHAFWSRFRQEVTLWTRRVESLEGDADVVTKTNESSASCNESTQRAQLRVDLALLNAELEALRKHCLSHATESSLYDNWTVPEELPMADMRLLHDEFAKCSDRLETATNKLLPKAKFSFQRYRQAKDQLQPQLHRQQEQPNQQSREGPISGAEVDTTSTGPAPGDSTDALSVRTKHSLENLSKVYVYVNPKGDAQVEQVGDSDSFPSTFDIATNPPSAGDGATSWVIRKVASSKVKMNNCMKELHISNVSDSTIWATESPIQGAIHITGCANVQLHVQSFHQLRMHESNNLQCHIQEPSSCGGAIMEDCSNMTFYIMTNIDSLSKNDGKNGSAFEVKDFNWLQNGIPSPNFRLLAEGLDSQKSTSFAHPSLSGKEDQNVAMNEAFVTEVHHHSDDEDEL